MVERILWIRADRGGDLNYRKRMVTTALENDILTIFTAKEDLDTLSKLGKFTPVVEESGRFRVNECKGAVFSIKSGEDVEKAVDAARMVDILVVSTDNWKVIPLENLIASFQTKDCKLVAGKID